MENKTNTYVLEEIIEIKEVTTFSEKANREYKTTSRKCLLCDQVFGRHKLALKHLEYEKQKQNPVTINQGTKLHSQLMITLLF